MPIISIILPVYNSEKYLCKCLDSLIAQTFRDIEIICVNDGSTDNCKDILDGYLKTDKRIKVININHLGPSGARNVGIKHAKGEYIMFVDSDDYIDLKTCETAYNEAIDENAQVVLWAYVSEYTTGRRNEKHLFGEDKVVLCDDEVRKKIHRRFFGLLGRELAHPELADSFSAVWNKLYKASLIKDNSVEFVDTQIIGTSEDALFNIDVFKYVTRCVYIDRILYHYNHYDHDADSVSFTSEYKPNLQSEWQKLFKIMAERIAESNLEDYYRLSLNNRISLSIIGFGLNLLQSNMSGKAMRLELQRVLGSEIYKEACKNLTLKYFPLHWKIFFFFAKQSFTFGVYILLLAIKKILRNK